MYLRTLVLLCCALPAPAIAPAAEIVGTTDREVARTDRVIEDDDDRDLRRS